MSLQINALTSAGFSGNIVLPNSEAWTDATQAWGAQSKRSPKILWLNQENLDFAVRSGGMAESQSDGAIIDLCFLDKVDYDAANNCFHLGPGQPWRNVYKKQENMPVTVMGGRVGFVGVGGFTIGGGLSYLANLHGLASDSILDAQIVLADGSIVRAKDNDDLFFAIRGAGHAFGVVTELVVRAYPKPTSVYGGFILFGLDKYAAICEHIADLAANNADPNVNAMVGLVRMPPAMDHIIILMPMVFGSPEYAKEALSWAWKLGPLQDLSSPVSYEQALAAQEMFVQRPATTTTYQQNSIVVSRLTPAVMQAALKWQVDLHKDPRFYGAAILIEPFFPGAFTPKDNKGNAWPHPRSFYVIEPFIEGRDTQPGRAEEEAELLRACSKAVENAADPGTILSKYPNYALVGTPAIDFYGENLPRLQAIKRRVDPKNRFNKGIKIIA
ncbi:hypothetical protein BDP27DRAFT_1311958 [Rhodocollybia butyracea]|uniref:FAD-binding PCMH-type domain-containing protein n=1 Tax=Rhodocollybia butyracea TaxID=206335 RepID=A0A9P5QB51_9AGAR|nr:hypothetical protein BDP27DRAFT_1311958 [Rhodocollybia butyracea]